MSRPERYIPHEVRSLVYSSVDDTKSTLPHRGDLSILQQAAKLCDEEGYKSKAVLIRARIRKLRRFVGPR